MDNYYCPTRMKNLLALFVILLTNLFIPFASIAENKTNWGNTERKKEIWKVWGREFYTAETKILPVNITSNNIQLFSAAPQTILNSTILSQRTSEPLTYDNNTDNKISTEQDFYQNGVKLNVKKTLDYDGFFMFDITLSPQKLIEIFEFGFDIPLNKSVATQFSRYLSYDFIRQRFDFDGMELASGTIDSNKYFSFTPTLWIGSKNAGIEWVSETNLNWKLDKENQALNIMTFENSTTLQIRFIQKKKGVKITQPVSYRFGFFVTPSRPSSNKKYRMISGETDISVCNSEIIQFHNWTKIPFLYPGLPVLKNSVDAKETYEHLISCLLYTSDAADE